VSIEAHRAGRVREILHLPPQNGDYKGLTFVPPNPITLQTLRAALSLWGLSTATSCWSLG
jgi:hypothetical protein